MIHTGYDSTESAQVRKDMEELQRELHAALAELFDGVGRKLSREERAELEEEFHDLDELLERIKSGMIWIAVFGKTSAGKSSVINSLVGADLSAVGITYNTTTDIIPYTKDPWVILDTPGALGTKCLEEKAVREAKQVLGVILVVDGQPLQDEIELFDDIHKSMPHTPKIVYANKEDLLLRMPSRDRDLVRNAICDTMLKYVASPEDIVFGSARLYDPQQDMYVRQDLPQLLDRMYASAGTLGAVMSVLDPAERASNSIGRVHDRIWDIRRKIARKGIGLFAVAEIAGGFVPFTTLTVSPGILAGLTFYLAKITGKKITQKDAGKIAIEVLKVMGQFLIADTIVLATADTIFSAANAVPIIGQAIFLLGSVGGLSYWRYRRTTTFGEIMLEYIRNDFSWGQEGPEAVVERCKREAKAIYTRFQKG